MRLSDWYSLGGALGDVALFVFFVYVIFWTSAALQTKKRPPDK